MIPVVRIERCVRCFEKVGDEFVKMIPLQGVTLQQLQRVFGLPPEDPMYECVPVEKRHAEALRPFAPEPIDVDSYDCFVECDAIPE